MARARREPPPRRWLPPRYRAAWLLDRTTAYGWHSFTFVADEPIPLLRCDGCYGIIAVHELTEGMWAPRLGSICSGILRALPPARQERENDD